MINRKILIICGDDGFASSVTEFLESFDSVSAATGNSNENSTLIAEKKSQVEHASSYDIALDLLSGCNDGALLPFSVVFIETFALNEQFAVLLDTLLLKNPMVHLVIAGEDIDDIAANWKFEGEAAAGRIIFLKSPCAPAVAAYSLFLLSDKFNLHKALNNTERLNIISSMTAGLIHDFNNVITGISVSAELLEMYIREKNRVYNSDLSDNIALIQRSVKQGTKLLDSILSVARSRDSSPSRININQALEDIIFLCSNIVEENIEFSFKPYEFESPVVYMPVTSFEQLAMNLIVNAAHSMTFMRSENEQKGGVITITVKSVIIPKKNQCHWEPGKYFKIDIADEGVGIKSENLKYIFDPFYTSKPEGKGTGVGLAAVKDILNRQSGT